MKETPPSSSSCPALIAAFNAAEDVTYSAHPRRRDGRQRAGIRSIALSAGVQRQDAQKPLWETSVRHGPDVIRKVLAVNLPTDTIVNINFPDCMPDEVEARRGDAAGQAQPGSPAR